MFYQGTKFRNHSFRKYSTFKLSRHDQHRIIGPHYCINERDIEAFCDTSFFFAPLYPKDVNYERAGQILVETLDQEISLWTPLDIISETATLLLYRFNAKAAIRFLDEIRLVLQVISYDDSARQEPEQIFGLFIRGKSFLLAMRFLTLS